MGVRVPRPVLYRPLAQPVEQLPHKEKVTGSIPVGTTIIPFLFGGSNYYPYLYFMERILKRLEKLEARLALYDRYYGRALDERVEEDDRGLREVYLESTPDEKLSESGLLAKRRQEALKETIFSTKWRDITPINRRLYKI